MILIQKQKEPHKWMLYRNTPGATYQSQDYLVESLLQEQGYICAYCMRRIPCKDRINGVLTQEDHRVEHVKCRNHYPHLQLTYNNMLICCPGHLGENPHCDRLKDDDSISFSPLDRAFVNTVYYENGEIKSTNAVWDKEMTEVLNLNDAALVAARKNMLDGVVKMIIRDLPQKAWTKQAIEKYIKKYSSPHSEKGELKYYPYCGIVVHYLQKKLRKCT